MKKLLYSAGIFLACAATQLSAQTSYKWERLAMTPYRGAVSNVAVTLDGKTYITTSRSVYRSTDNGLHWEVFPGSYGGNFSDIATYGTNTNALFVGTDWHMAWTVTGSNWRTQSFKVNSHTGLGGGVGELHINDANGVIFSGNYMIQPSGAWTEILKGASIQDYVMEKGKPMLALASSTDGMNVQHKIYRSDDGGMNWTPIADMPGYGKLFSGNGKIFAQIEKYENQENKRIFFASGDWGNSWAEVKFSSTGLPAGIDRIDIIDMQGGRIFAALTVPGTFYTKGLYISDDEMKSWTLLHPSLENISVAELGFALKMDQTQNGNIFITTLDRGVLYFDKEKNSVEERNTGLFAEEPQNLLFAHNKMFAYDMNGIVRSDDGGLSWRKISFDNANMRSRSMAALSTGELLLGSMTSKLSGGSALLKSTNGGESWIDSDEGITLGTANWAMVDEIQVSGEKILALVSQNSTMKLYMSEDRAQSWKEITIPEDQNLTLGIRQFAVTKSGEIFVGSLRGFAMESVLLHSADLGKSWREIELPSQIQFIGSVSFQQDQFGNVYLVDANGGNVFVRKNNSWELVMSNVDENSKWYFDRENNIFRISYNGMSEWFGVKFSSDGGKNWETINNGLPQNLDEEPVAAITFNEQNIAYATLSSGEIYRLTESLTSVEENSSEENYSASPNPFTNFTTISFDSKENSPARISFYSTLGEEIFSQEILLHEGKNSFVIPAGNFSLGVYHFRILGENFVRNGSVVKK